MPEAIVRWVPAARACHRTAASSAPDCSAAPPASPKCPGSGWRGGTPLAFDASKEGPYRAIWYRERDGQWTIEAADWATGSSQFHYVLGGSQFNTVGAGITVDEDGRLLFGSMYGKTRILRGER